MPSPLATTQSIQTIESSESTDSATHLDSSSCSTTDAATNAEKSSFLPRPIRIYTRPQLLSLSKSPMVEPPPDMPDLRTWFGWVASLPNLSCFLISLPALRMRISSIKKTNSQPRIPLEIDGRSFSIFIITAAQRVTPSLSFRRDIEDGGQCLLISSF